MKKSIIVVLCFIIILCLILFAELTYALEIHQVYYDPIDTENGGEAIELYNPSSERINISGLIIKTKASSKDAVISSDTSVEAGNYFLITDAGWDSNKDNKSWRNSDHEESLTLSNTAGGIALILNGEIIDAVGWGNIQEINNEELYENSPHSGVEEGKSLLRIKDTNNNKDDFISSTPDFSIKAGKENQMENTNRFNTTTEVVLNSSSTIIVNVNIAQPALYPINFENMLKENKSKEDIIIKLLFDELAYKSDDVKENDIVKKEKMIKQYDEKTSALLREVNHKQTYNENEMIDIITFVENNGDIEIEAHAEHNFYLNDRLISLYKSQPILIVPEKTEKLHAFIEGLPSGRYNVKTKVYYNKRYTDETETNLTVSNGNQITGDFVKVEKVKDIGFVVFLILIIIIGVVLIKKYK